MQAVAATLVAVVALVAGCGRADDEPLDAGAGDFAVGSAPPDLATEMDL